jgi:histidinol-phosphate aminotransferase
MNTASVLERFLTPTARRADPYNAKHHDYAWQRPNLARLMSNECPLPPSQRVIAAAARALASCNLYPNSGEDVRAQLAAFAGVATECIVLGNGSTEILDVITRIFLEPGDEAIIPIPTYAFFETQTRVHGGTPVLIDLGPAFELEMDALRAAISRRTKIVFLCSPNNPTGNAWSADQLRDVLSLGVPVVVDQAYLECGRSESFAPLVLEHPNLVVTRTMSKAFGLAGLRLGYAIADPVIIDAITRVRIPFSVSMVALQAALAALEDPEDLAQRSGHIIGERQRLHTALAGIPLVRPYLSEGNFILMDVRGLGIAAESVVERLQADGMLLRAMQAHRLRGAFVRLTVGTVEQNNAFLSAFERLCGTLADSASPRSPNGHALAAEGGDRGAA